MLLGTFFHALQEEIIMKKFLSPVQAALSAPAFCSNGRESTMLCALSKKAFFCTADEALTRAQVEALHPDVILHTAALSDTSYCAQHPAEAYRANVELPVWLARAAQQTKAKLVAFSSDQVYAGVQQQGPLPEILALHPANILRPIQAGSRAACAGALPGLGPSACQLDV